MSTPVSDIDAKLKAPDFDLDVGDHVSVSVLIREPAPKDAKDKSERTRIQKFNGDVIAIGGTGAGRAFTVRRVVQGEGVERVFPVHSPLVVAVKVERKGKVRRAKLYDLREKSGKAARIKEKVGGAREIAQKDAKRKAAAEAAEKAAAEAEAKAKAAAEADAAAAAAAAAEEASQGSAAADSAETVPAGAGETEQTPKSKDA